VKTSFPLYSLNRGLGGITPEYVQRAWGGRVAIEDIEAADKRAMRTVGYETHELCSLVSDKNSNREHGSLLVL
jgi:hypothetical protein